MFDVISDLFNGGAGAPIIFLAVYVIVPLFINIVSKGKYNHAMRVSQAQRNRIIGYENTTLFDLKKTTYGHVLRTGTLEEILEGKDELADGTYDQHLGNYSGEVSRQLPENMLKANTGLNKQVSSSNNSVKHLNINESYNSHRPAPLNVRQLNESRSNFEMGSGVKKEGGLKLSDFTKDGNK